MIDRMTTIVVKKQGLYTENDQDFSQESDDHEADSLGEDDQSEHMIEAMFRE